MLRNILGDAKGWAALVGNSGWNGFPSEVKHTEVWAALLGSECLASAPSVPTGLREPVQIPEHHRR